MSIDVYQSITDKIVAQLEQPNQLGGWQRPWYQTQLGMMPRNADGRFYKGVNTLVLWCSAMEHHYLNPIWGTYRQWQSKGQQVRKGEKSELVVFYKTYEQFNPETKSEDKFRIARGFYVFNIQQLENWEMIPISTPHTELSEDERLQSVDDWFHNVGAEVKHGGDRAFYSPTSDFIGMPAFGQFRDGYAYYSTLAHEHTHWTGHKSRLDRELATARFGDEAYAFEELVAELGAAFTCGLLDTHNEPRDDHAKYLASWLKVLKQDKKAIFTAASAAQRAVDYLAAFQPQGVTETEDEEEYVGK